MAVMLVAAGACLYGDDLEAQLTRIACNKIGTEQKTCSSGTLIK